MGQGYQRFSFPTIKNSARADYYFEIQVVDGQGAKLFAAPGETYLNGALYLDQSAQDAQLAFRLAYDRVEFGMGLFSEVLHWVWYLILGGWLFILPGWALLQLLLGEDWSKRDWTEKAALATGAGVALFPVLLLWSKLFHLRLGSVYIWVFPAAAAIYLAWKTENCSLRGRKPGGSQKPADLAYKFNLSCRYSVDFLFQVLGNPRRRCTLMGQLIPAHDDRATDC